VLGSSWIVLVLKRDEALASVATPWLIPTCDNGLCLCVYTLDVSNNSDHVYQGSLVVHMGTFHSCSRISTSNRPS
jgi:hypothetical protein